MGVFSQLRERLRSSEPGALPSPAAGEPPPDLIAALSAGGSAGDAKSDRLVSDKELAEGSGGGSDCASEAGSDTTAGDVECGVCLDRTVRHAA